MPEDASRDGSCVLVTGAAGHLGANLVRALLAQGRRVRALVHREARALEGLAVETVKGDLLDRDSLRAACAGATTVFHLAAVVSAGWQKASTVDAVNERGTVLVVEACQARGVRRLVHFSSVAALDARGVDLLDESCPLLPAGQGDVYARSKAAAERAVLGAVERGLDAVILSPTAVLGPFDFAPSPMGEVLLGLARGKVPALVAGALCDFVDARDVAAAALEAERRGGRGQRYLASGTRLSLVDLAQRWSSATGRRAPRFAVPMALARMVAPFAAAQARLRRRRALFSSQSLAIVRTQPPVRRERAERELDYQPRGIDETLHDTWAWMREQGWL